MKSFKNGSSKAKSRGKGVMKQYPIHFRTGFVISEGKIKEYNNLIKETSKQTGRGQST